MAVIRKAKDTGLKLILDQPELFVEFLRDFVDIDILKNIAPSDIEDMTDRLLPILTEQKDLDTIKRINLKDGKELFVITIIEHESAVNYRASFKMLLYIVLVLDNYEKEVNKKGKVTQAKDFKYPPILPIVFYDGTDEWTAEKNFLYRTEMSEIFEKYIPKFEYELVSLKDYSFEDLAEFGDTISLFMMIDKLKTAEAFAEMGKLREEYGDKLNSLNVPPHLKELLVRLITLLLSKIDISQDEIEEFVEKIDERGMSEMLLIENYSVRETRQQARAEAMAEVELQISEAEQKLKKAQYVLKSAVNVLLGKGYSISELSSTLNVTEQDIIEVLPELA